MWQLYLAKAQSNLQAAERDQSHRAFDSCVSRAYLLPSRQQSLPCLPLPTTSEEANTGTMVRLPPNLPDDLSVSVKSLEVRSPVSSMT